MSKVRTAGRKKLISVMPYEPPTLLVDRVIARVNDQNELTRVHGFYKVNSNQNDYFHGHFKGETKLFPGFGGYCEFAAQTVVAGYFAAGQADKVIVLSGADNIHINVPARDGRELVAVAAPVATANGGPKEFDCIIYGASDFKKRGKRARQYASVRIRGARSNA